MDWDVHTTLAMVHTYPDGDRDFSFYRSPGADMMLREDELDEKALENTRIFHFGTLSMTDPEVRAATKKAVGIAKESGAVIPLTPIFVHRYGSRWMTQRHRLPMVFPSVIFSRYLITRSNGLPGRLSLMLVSVN